MSWLSDKADTLAQENESLREAVNELYQRIGEVRADGSALSDPAAQLKSIRRVTLRADEDVARLYRIVSDVLDMDATPEFVKSLLRAEFQQTHRYHELTA